MTADLDDGAAHRFAAHELLTEYRNSGDRQVLARAIESLRALTTRPVHDDEYQLDRSSLGLALRYRHLVDHDPETLREALTHTGIAYRSVDAASPLHPHCAINYAGVLHAVHDATADPTSLDTAITIARAACAALAPGTTAHTLATNDLGYFLQTRARARADTEDLSEAVRLGRQAVAAPNDDDYAIRIVSGNLVVSLLTMLEHTETVPLLREAIEHLEFGSATPIPDPVRNTDRMLVLADLHGRLYHRTGEGSALRAALTTLRAAARDAPVDYPRRYVLALRLGNALLLAAQHTDPDCLDEAIAAFHAGSRAGGIESVPFLSGLGVCLRLRFERDGDPATLEQAVRASASAARQVPAEHPERTAYLANHGAALRSRFESHGDLADLREARTVLREAVDVVPPERAAFEWAAWLNLSDTLLMLFDKAAEIDHLHEVVALLESAPALYAENAVARGRLLANLGMARQRLALCDDTPGHVAAAIAALCGAADALPADAPDRPRVLATAGNLLIVWESLHDEPDSRATGSRMLRAAVEAAPDGHPYRNLVQHSLALTLRYLAERENSPDLEAQSLAAFRDAVTATPSDHPKRGYFRSQLGEALIRNYLRTRDTTLLDEALRELRAVVAATPAGHVDRADYLIALSSALMHSCERTVDAALREEFVLVARSAVAARPEDDYNYPTTLANLAVALTLSSTQSGESAPAVEAVRCARMAVERIDDDHPNRPVVLGALASACLRDFESTGDQDALREAVRIGRSTIDALTSEDPEWALRHSNHALALGTLFRQTVQPALLDEAIQAARTAVAAAPIDHPMQALYLTNYANLLETADLYRPEPALVEEMLRLARAALAAAPADHPTRSTIQRNIGAAAFKLYTFVERPSLLADARAAFTTAAESPNSDVGNRILALRALGQVELRAGDSQAALRAYELVVELLPLYAPRSVPREHRQVSLARMAGLASELAEAAVLAGQPGRAVELLEQTRGLLLGETLEVRSDVTALRAAYPDLADRFDELRRCALDLDTSTVGGAEFGHGVDYRPAVGIEHSHQSVAAQWTILLDEVRSRPGFADFLRPPGIDRLRAQAAHGPIVLVYAGSTHGGALVLEHRPDRPVRSIRLPGLAGHAVFGQVEALWAALDAAEGPVAGRRAGQLALLEHLRWLWDVLAGPVLDTLGAADSAPRVWWCPVGVLAFLPIHAAGHHDSADRRSAVDRCVSSYLTTIRTLEHTRARRIAPPGSSVVIAVPDVAGDPIPGAYEEAETVAGLLPNPVRLNQIEATHAAVATALLAHPIAHFACHGWSDPQNPALSRLVLVDDDSRPFTIRALSRLDLAGADLAYLSACATARTTPALVDEAIHLAGAVNAAGYRHVIATLWRVNDAAATAVATDFYAHLTAAGRPVRTELSAHAVNAAIRRLRDRYPSLPTRWAAFIHQGG
ncbi:CHAT domain-containing protein [Nocardia sp. NPDC127579]|uniref:CHAT domain-containing protein n=1 Tax=Nocardia sp. NPDC127579 TaxID=3345402 RepID=UPI00362547EC